MKKFIALVLALSMLLCFAACGAKDEDPTATQTDAQSEAPMQDETEAEMADATTLPDTEETSAEDVSFSEDESTLEGAAVDAVPATTEEIVAAYTEAMNYVKTVHPGFTKIEYQVLPEDKRNFDGKVASTILDLASNFMTTKADAKANPEIREKGYNGEYFPIYKSSKGCMLTDMSAVKSAKCETLANGNYKITIVLKPESNPEPVNPATNKSPSRHGEIFSPLSKKEIDDTLENNKLVNVVVKSAEYDLKYYDCTAILIYNPANNHIESLTQYNHVLINADADLRLLGAFKGSAVLDNTLVADNFKY